MSDPQWKKVARALASYWQELEGAVVKAGYRDRRFFNEEWFLDSTVVWALAAGSERILVDTQMHVGGPKEWAKYVGVSQDPCYACGEDLVKEHPSGSRGAPRFVRKVHKNRPKMPEGTCNGGDNAAMSQCPCTGLRKCAQKLYEEAGRGGGSTAKKFDIFAPSLSRAHDPKVCVFGPQFRFVKGDPGWVQHSRTLIVRGDCAPSPLAEFK